MTLTHTPTDVPLVGPLIGGFLVQLASEQFRAVGLNHMLFFSLMVILIVRLAREGLWGLAMRALRPWLGAPARKARTAAAGS